MSFSQRIILICQQVAGTNRKFETHKLESGLSSDSRPSVSLSEKGVFLNSLEGFFSLSRFAGSLDIGDDGHLLTINPSSIEGLHRVRSKHVWGNQMMRVASVAKLNGGIFKSMPIVPSHFFSV